MNDSLLQINSNQLTNIPTEIGSLSGLTYLGFGHNSLSFLPTEIALLTGLTELHEERISLLDLMERMYVDANRLTEIPTEYGLLTNVIHLGLCNNFLTSLPTELKSLAQLQYTSDWANAKNNYLDCAEIQQYLPSSIAADYCGTQKTCSSQSPCDGVPVCKTENNVCRIQCGAEHNRNGEYCHHDLDPESIQKQQDVLNKIAEQLTKDRGAVCTAPVIGRSTSGTNCGTYEIAIDNSKNVVALFVQILHITLLIWGDLRNTKLSNVPTEIGLLTALTWL